MATFPSSEFQDRLLDWYRRNARPLPWRESPSLYRTVVSEFMLQQTQVATALPYFHRWMAALPDFGALARADEAVVLRLWEGLGYYSRARNLHRLARELVQRERLPVTAAEWRELPGIGPYTSAAIASIANGEPVACVDGNVVRILARLSAEPRQFRDGSEAARHFAPLAQSLLNRDDAGSHNQAMMELGATLCTRARPKCSSCPVAGNCAARTVGPENFPRLAPVKTEQQSVTRVWCVQGNAILLHRAPATSRRLAGQHELPAAGQLGLTDSSARTGRLLAMKKRSITRYRITESIHAAPPPPTLPADVAWVPIHRLRDITLSGPHRRWITELLPSWRELKAEG